MNFVLLSRQVKQEIHAQLQWFVDAVGLLPTHIDGHQHVHIMPQVCEIIAVVMKNAGIKWTRIPAEMNFDSCVWIEEPRRSFFQSVVSQARDAKETFSTHGIKQVKVGLWTNIDIHKLLFYFIDVYQIHGQTI